MNRSLLTTVASFFIFQFALAGLIDQPSALLENQRMIQSSATEKGGYEISEIEPGSIFDKLGFKKGDIIKKIDGKEAPEFSSLLDILNELQKHDALTVDVLREGKIKTLTLKAKK